jgi:NADH-quinone oxidoreductase subunit M
VSALVLLVPLLTALVLAFVRSARAAGVVALAGTLATFVLALFLPGSAGVSALWIPGFGSYFELSPEGAGGVLVLVAALAMIPAAAHASRTVRERPGAFLALLLAMQAGLNGIFLAKDLVLFYVFWEATLIPSLAMLGVWGGPERRRATFKYLLYAVAGSFLMLVAILAIKPLSGAVSYRFADLYQVTPLLDYYTQLWLFLGFTAAFAVKLPLWPVHSWLIDFHEQNHPSGAADVAGTLYKVGAFGFFAWALPLLPAAASAVAPVLLAMSAATALYAAVIATAQTHLKRLLAYASLSHMGMIGVGVFALHVAGLNGAVYFLAAQMLSTGGLFLLSGMLYARRGSFHLDAYGGLARSAPALAAVTLFVLFAAIGVPGLGNFPGEFLSLLGGFQASPWLVGLLATPAVIAAGVYGVNLYQRVFQGPPREAARDLSGLELFVMVPILAGILWLGLAPQPQLERIEVQSRLVTESQALARAPFLVAEEAE